MSLRFLLDKNKCFEKLWQSVTEDHGARLSQKIFMDLVDKIEL